MFQLRFLILRNQKAFSPLYQILKKGNQERSNHCNFLFVGGTVGISLRRTLYYDFVYLAIIVSFILSQHRK